MMNRFTGFFDWLFGTNDTAEILDIEWSFAYGIPGWVGVLLLIAIAIYCYKIYKREASSLNRGLRIFLTTMRFFTYAALLLVFLKPSMLMDRMVEPKSIVAIVFDASQSMGITEKGASQEYVDLVAQRTGVSQEEAKKIDRMTIVNKVMNNPDLSLTEDLAEKYSLRFYSFSKEALPYDANGENGEEVVTPDADGKITQLGAAVRQVAHDLRGHPLAGIVMLTDGGNNKGEDPELVAQNMGKKGVRLFPIGIGAPQAVDIKVVDFNIPDLIFKDEELAVEVTFEGSAIAGNLIPVALTLGGEPVGGDTIEGREGIFKENFVIRATKTGDFTFKTTADPQPNEYFLENNKKTKQIRVIDNAIRVLFVIENPSWEYRYLKGMLDIDRRVETKVFIRRGDPRRSRSDEQYVSRLPFDDLNKKYDCLVFCNIRADYFDRRKMEQIRDYVAKDGGSIIMISSTSGTPGTFAGTPIGDMLPVTFKAIPEHESLDLDQRFTNPFPLRLTREGRFHNITRLEPLPEENERLWPTLPAHYWYYTGIRKLKPSAIALVVHGQAANEHGPIPLIATHRYGKGQVLFLGINSIWRWRYRIGNKLTNRFWIQTMQFMGLPHLLGNMKRVQIMTEGRNFTVGEKIDINAKLLTENYTPLRKDDITLVAQNSETLTEQTFTIQASKLKEGFYEGAIFLKEGRWNLTVDGYRDEEELVLEISEARYEFEKPAMQQVTLENMAKASGGAFFTLKDIDTVPEKISERVELVRSPIEKTMWDTWLALLIIACTTGLEWFFRRRVDLP